MGSSGKRPTRRLAKLVILAVAVTGFMTFGVSHALATTVTCGQVLTQNTHVSNDLLNCPNDGLVIGANNIKVNLGGHLIDGDGMNTFTDDGIDNTGGFDGVEVKRGTIQQFSQGVNLLGASDNDLQQLEVMFNGFAILINPGSDNTTVERSVVHDNPRPGGILADGTTGVVFTNNTVYDNGSGGIGSVGIALWNSTNGEISRNDVSGSAMSGIVLVNTDTSVVEANQVTTSGFDGIETRGGSTGNLLQNNDANTNGWNGIDVGDPGNTIKKNQADFNFNLGIFAAPGNIDGGGNKAQGNGDPLQCVGVFCS
jgi:parallel beta-helix repeat protein